MNDHTMHTDNDALAADVADLEESLYEFHLRLRDMIARHLWQGASREQRMAGLLIEGIDNDRTVPPCGRDTETPEGVTD